MDCFTVLLMTLRVGQATSGLPLFLPRVVNRGCSLRLSTPTQPSSTGRQMAGRSWSVRLGELPVGFRRSISTSGTITDLNNANEVLTGASMNRSRTMLGFTLQASDKAQEAFVSGINSFYQCRSVR